MSELDFRVEGAEIAGFAAAPTLNFLLRVDSVPTLAEIANVMLQCQLQIDAPRRRYSGAEQALLREQFGDPARASLVPHPLLWTHLSVLVPSFTDHCTIDLPVPCSFDFNVAAVKYFYALEDGKVPLSFQFSGSVFYRDEDAALQVSRIGWTKEARFALPVALWQQLMDRYYPNSAWLHLDRTLFDRLYRYKSEHGLALWDDALARLLNRAGETVR
jgi:hypothetical protein